MNSQPTAAEPPEVTFCLTKYYDLASDLTGRWNLLYEWQDGMSVLYQQEPDLSSDEFVSVLNRSTLGERRPVDDQTRIQAMLRHADLILTARVEGRLIGVSRALTDFSFCTYLSDLAVDEAFQKQGIGRQLIERTHQAAGRQTRLILIAAPKARSYYPHIGMVPHDSCWMLEPLPEAYAAEF